jgi:hypothetical protein
MAPQKPYVFVHDDVARSYAVRDDHIPRGAHIVRPVSGVTNIFGYLKLIEEAEEVHCIDSCFMFMIDSMDVGKNLHIHRYARTLDAFNAPIIVRDWKVLA